MTGRAGCTRVHGALLSLLLVAGLLLTGCSDDPAAKPSAAESTSASTEPSPSATPRTSAQKKEAACRRQQKNVMQDLWEVSEVTDRVTESPTGESPLAARLINRIAGTAERRVQRVCGGTPAELQPFLDEARRNSLQTLDDRDLDRILATLLSWGTAIGEAQRYEDAIESLRQCRSLVDKVVASHRVWWRWTSTGKAWWIELTFHNDTQQTYYPSLSGTVMVTGLDPSELPVENGRRVPVDTLHWGGSSADTGQINRGVSRQLVAPGADPYVLTTTDGTLQVIDARVEVSVNHEAGSCAIPVPEKS